MFSRQHELELGEIKAIASDLMARVTEAQVKVARIRETQGRLLSEARPRESGSGRRGLSADGAGSVIAFVHIPKTAGTTAINMLTAAYSKPAIDDAGNFITGPEKVAAKLTRRPGGWENWHRRGGRVTAGHVPYGVFRKYLPENARYMTFLREPVDRVLSHYYRHVHRPDMSSAERLAARTEKGNQLAGSLEEAFTELQVPQLNNLATRFLCGHPDPIGTLPESALEDAKANLRDFAFVGIQERFPESIVLLQRTLGLGLVLYLNRHISVGRPGVEELSDTDRALIAEHNQLDVELYEFATDLFEDAVASAGAGFAADAERMQELSAQENEAAIRRAEEWLERHLPPGSVKLTNELRRAGTEEGIPMAALKNARTRIEHARGRSG